MDEICKFDDLVERNGLFYEKFTDVPFTGEVTGWIVIDEMRLKGRQTSKMQGRIGEHYLCQRRHHWGPIRSQTWIGNRPYGAEFQD